MDERIGSVLLRIPGYAGYRKKEERRDDDKRIRVVIADELTGLVDSLTRQNASLVEQRELSRISRIERVVGKLRLLSDRLRTATYGYGGVFTENSVDEMVLDQIRQFDLAFQREIVELSKIVATVSNTVTPPTDADLETLESEISRLGLLVNSRSQVMDTAKPHEDAEVLTLLEENPPANVSPLLSVGLGDTFSVLGDNYRTDAIITLVAGETRLQLSRVGENEQGLAQWFLASTTPEIPTALLLERDTKGVPVAPMKPAAANVQSANGKREGVSAQYASAADGGTDGEITFSYSIGDESRYLTGRKVNDVDIELYGAA